MSEPGAEQTGMERTPPSSGTDGSSGLAHGQTLAVPETILHPVSGELVPTNDPRAVAEAITLLNRASDDLRTARGLFVEALVAESARVGTKTLHIDGYHIEVKDSPDIEWDIPRLEAELRALGLPEERLTRLVKTEITYRVDGTVARQLAGANPDYAAVIESCKTRIPKRPSATVKEA